MRDTHGIAVAHPDLMAKGGAEGVAMNILESLQNHYDITLLTLTDPDVLALNEYYNTKVNECTLNIEQVGKPFQLLYNNSSRFHLFKRSVLSRSVKRQQGRFDLIVSSYNEISLQTPSLQYIHMPQYRRWLSSDYRSLSVYDNICKYLEGFNPDAIRASYLVANSEWTANITEDVYNVRPEVIYPPIDTAEFVNMPWSKREPGFVTIGRLTPNKNVLRTIKIIKRLRQRGHDVHLHIVGPDCKSSYTEKVRAAASAVSFVHLEGEMTRDNLVELISSHRYGIHGRHEEHFGMAVAEFAVGGAVPFVPDNGGQREIVKKREELRYNSIDEAVEKIERVLSNPALQRELRDELSDSRERFGRKRFQKDIRDSVSNIINAPGTSS